MANKAKIFLSTPMPTGDLEWIRLRDIISCWFEKCGLHSIFDLERIETEGGAHPRDIYLDLVSTCDIILVIFTEEIRPGQKDEIHRAIAENIPILAIRINENGNKLSKETNIFIKSTLYNSTKVESVKSIKELLLHIESSIPGIIRRGFQHARATKIAMDTVVRSDQTNNLPYTNDTISALGRFAIEESGSDAILFLAKHTDVSTENGLLLYCTLLLNDDNTDISDVNSDKIAELSKDDSSAMYIRIGIAIKSEHYHDVYNIIRESTRKNDKILTALNRITEFLETYSMQCDAEDVVDVWEQLDVLSDLTVFGLEIFAWLIELVHGLMHGANINASSFLPEAKNCLNCMPRDSGEFIELSSVRGTVLDLILDKLSGDYPDIPWHEFNIDARDVSCSHCGTSLSIDDGVYSNIYE